MKMRKYILAIFILFLGSFSAPAYADRCWMTGGCVGEVGYMHVPFTQRTAADVFVKSGLPPVNSTAVLKKNGFYFMPSSISDERLPIDLSRAIKEKAQLAWGGELAKGAKVLVLGYQTFPQLKGALGDEIFILVLVRTDQ
jgi:hypothetical protein